MHEIFIHKVYQHNDLLELLNEHLAENVDGVIICWDHNTSIFIEKLNNITIDKTLSIIQSLLGDVRIELDPEDDKE